MARKRKELELSLVLQKIRGSGIKDNQPPNLVKEDIDDLESLSSRVKKILGLIESPKRKQGNMLFFVMYDIESNKVRRQVAKYLVKKGCTRVQHSVFLADIDAEKYRKIRDDLTDVQSFYDNHDSILICPVSTDLIKSMKIIGKNINIDLITHSKNTLFF